MKTLTITIFTLVLCQSALTQSAVDSIPMSIGETIQLSQMSWGYITSPEDHAPEIVDAKEILPGKIEVRYYYWWEADSITIFNKTGEAVHSEPFIRYHSSTGYMPQWCRYTCRTNTKY